MARCCDDFYPSDPASHTSHIGNAAFNSLFLGALVQPDWDMFHVRNPLPPPAHLLHRLDVADCVIGNASLRQQPQHPPIIGVAWIAATEICFVSAHVLLSAVTPPLHPLTESAPGSRAPCRSEERERFRGIRERQARPP